MVMLYYFRLHLEVKILKDKCSQQEERLDKIKSQKKNDKVIQEYTYKIILNVKKIYYKTQNL